MKISKYWSLSRGLGIYNFSAQIPPYVYYSEVSLPSAVVEQQQQ